MKFFNPTSELKELLLLQHIEDKPNTTHKEMARVIQGAASMVNVYIDRMEEDGYLVRKYQSAKIVYYNITPEGVKRKKFLLINYLRELLDLYKLAKNNVESFLSEVESKGNKKILIYGAGEVAETILGVIRDRNNETLKVLAVVDDDKDMQGKELLGFRIISREEIKQYEHDGIIITSYAFEDDILKKLDEIDYPGDRVEKFFTQDKQ